MVGKEDLDQGDSQPSEEKRVRGIKGKKRAQRSARPKKLKKRAEARSSREQKAPPGNEAKQMLKKIEGLYGQLEDQLAEVYQNLHILPLELQKLATEPEIFLKDHDVILQTYEEDMEAKLEKIFGRTKVLRKKRKKAKKKAKRGRKAQKLRAKKKWIPLD